MSQQPEKYPYIQLAMLPTGIALTIVRSAWEVNQLVIPPENADAMCAAWLATRPKEVMKTVIDTRRVSLSTLPTEKVRALHG